MLVTAPVLCKGRISLRCTVENTGRLVVGPQAPRVNVPASQEELQSTARPPHATAVPARPVHLQPASVCVPSRDGPLCFLLFTAFLQTQDGLKLIWRRTSSAGYSRCRSRYTRRPDTSREQPRRPLLWGEDRPWRFRHVPGALVPSPLCCLRSRTQSRAGRSLGAGAGRRSSKSAV